MAWIVYKFVFKKQRRFQNSLPAEADRELWWSFDLNLAGIIDIFGQKWHRLGFEKIDSIYSDPVRVFSG